MSKIKKFKLKSFDSRGYFLTPIELKDAVPFEVRRLYYMDAPDSISTGEHCHKIEEEFFIQAKGSSTIIIDQGSGKEDFALSQGDAIYVPAYVWHGFKNTAGGCLILALSSTNYSADRSDYIEDYNEFLKVRK